MRLSGSRHKLDEASSASSPRGTPGPGRRTINTLDISHAESINLLSSAEKELCASLRIYPKPYLLIKDMLLREYLTKGALKLSQAKALLKMDPLKTKKIFQHFCESGWIKSVFPF